MSQNLKERLAQKSLQLKYNKFNTYSRFKTKLNKGYKGFYYINTRKQKLDNLIDILNDDKDYYKTIYKDKGIIPVMFKTQYLLPLSGDYYELIAIITKLFNCVAIWDNHFYGKQIEPIKTIRLFGFKPDVYLCNRYLKMEIDNIQNIQFNRQQYYRVVRRRIRRNGGKTSNMLDARTKTLKYHKRLLSQLSSLWLNVYKNVKRHTYEEYKYNKINELLETRGMLNYNKHGNKFNNAICPKFKFVHGKIISFKKVYPSVK